MDNKKIGNLIAKLRKEKGFTQQELGDKVNVGSRAVSKWECGVTAPDISIINELSEVLGISSDELLTGKLKSNKEIKSNHKPKNKLNDKSNNKTKKFIIIFLILIALATTLTISQLIYFNNKTYTYNLTAVEHDKYQVEGYVTYQKNKIEMFINQFKLNDSKLINMKIIDYQYNIKLGDTHIFGYGQTQEDVDAYRFYTISDIEKVIKKGYIEYNEISKNELAIYNFSILITITDEQHDDYNYQITMSLH